MTTTTDPDFGAREALRLLGTSSLETTSRGNCSIGQGACAVHTLFLPQRHRGHKERIIKTSIWRRNLKPLTSVISAPLW